MRVLKFNDVLENLVKKYNKGEWDEDLMQEAWLTAIECEKANKDSTDEELKRKVIVWVKNRLINIQTKKRLKTISLDADWEEPKSEDLYKVLFELKESLTERDNKILDLLLEGDDAKTIAKKMNISLRTIYLTFNKIKKILKS